MKTSEEVYARILSDPALDKSRSVGVLSLPLLCP